MKLVVAGNYSQYLNYVRDNNLKPSETRYVGRTEQIYGVEYFEDELVLIGTWQNNPLIDISVIRARAKRRRAR